MDQQIDYVYVSVNGITFKVDAAPWASYVVQVTIFRECTRTQKVL